MVASRIRRVLITPVLFSLAVLAASCGGGSGAGETTEASVSVTVTPATSAILPAQTVQLTAAVSGTSNTAVVWSLNGPSSSFGNWGTVRPDGLYTAPGSAVDGPITVTATSGQDNSKHASATVWVLASGQVSATNNPQVARYTLTVPTDANVTIQFGPDTGSELRTWTRPAPAGGGPVSILVAGMRGFTTYHMRAIAELSDGAEFDDADHTFTTGGVPATRMPQLTITQPGSLAPNPGVEMLSLIQLGAPPLPADQNQLHAAVVDLEGNLIWYYDFDPDGTLGGGVDPIKLLPNGNMLVLRWPPEHNLLEEVTLEGEVIRSVDGATLSDRLAQAGFSLSVTYLHHAVAVLPNGHFIVLAAHIKQFTDLPGYPGTTTVDGDALIDLDENWNPVWAWDTFDHLDVNRHPLGFPPDWTHSNAVIYSPDDGNLLLSMRNQHWLIKIDYEDGQGNGDVLWRFGYQGDFTLDSGAPAAWQYGQHFPIFLSPDTVGIFRLGFFDNGNNRVLDDAGTICGSTGAPPCYSRVPIFSVNETTKMVHVDWEDKLEVFSGALGSMQILDNGNVEFDAGITQAFPATALIREVTQETPPQTVWQMDLTGQVAYRALRIPSLYPGVQW